MKKAAGRLITMGVHTVTKRIKSALVSVFLLALLPGMSSGAPLGQPKGEIMLTVTGNITNTNTPEKTAAFDAAMLKAIGIKEIKTSTTWTAGTPSFKGPLARAILALVGAKGTTVTAIALNDYKVDIPMADFTHYDVILAMTVDDKPMSRREKGPLWIIYPRDDHPDLKTPEMDSRFLWQLKTLEVH